MNEECLKLPEGFSSKKVEGFIIIVDPEDNAIAQFAEEIDLSQKRFQRLIEEKVKESQTIFSRRSAQ